MLYGLVRAHAVGEVVVARGPAGLDAQLEDLGGLVRQETWLCGMGCFG